MNDRIVKIVHRKDRGSTRIFKTVMIVFAVLFLLMGIMFSRGFMLPCFLMAALYFIYDLFAGRDYEYTLEGKRLYIDVIRGQKMRKREHALDLDEMEVTAPHDSSRVDRYRKGTGQEKLPKYDYTSYEEGVPYYTMIVREDNRKEKLLLDLDDEMLAQLARLYPGKVERQRTDRG